MFDVGWSELLVIGAVALIVIGPKDIPKALRTLGQMTGKLRRMAGEFQSQFNDAIKESEFEQLKKDVADINESVRDATKADFNPIQTIRNDIKGAIEGRKASDDPAGQHAVVTDPIVSIDPPSLPQPGATAMIDHPTPVVTEKPKRVRKAKTAAPDTGEGA
jgi:sec-independent protein translocase protein TatB